jgi:hypothetical protein
MRNSAHLIDQEELMAYLDGELPVERAAIVASHLEKCAECKALSDDLRSVSQHIAAWQVGESSPHLASKVMATFDEHTNSVQEQRGTEATSIVLKPGPRQLRRWVLGLAGGLAALVVLFAISMPNLLKSRQAANQATIYAGHNQMGEGVLGSRLTETVREESELPAGPMIIRTAGLTLITKDFEKTRAEAEAIIRRHQGYSAQLSVTGQSGAGRALSATFRVPANQLDAALSELKVLAQVDQESQGVEEITRQFVDLSARLANAQNTEQRLNELMRQHSGKITDILAVENEISRVRGEIERMDAERTNLQNQIQYATLQLKLSEEYKAQIDVPATSTGTQLHNALVDGYRGALDSAVGLVVSLLSYGPTILFWGLLLYFPSRLVWKRLRLKGITSRADA